MKQAFKLVTEMGAALDAECAERRHAGAGGVTGAVLLDLLREHHVGPDRCGVLDALEGEIAPSVPVEPTEPQVPTGN